jgi:hypothetical protein
MEGFWCFELHTDPIEEIQEVCIDRFYLVRPKISQDMIDLGKTPGYVPALNPVNGFERFPRMGLVKGQRPFPGCRLVESGKA